MKSGLQIGAVARLDLKVGGSDVIHLGARQPQSAIVFSTPSMINLMEHAAREALRPFLDSNEESVGVNVFVEHLAATPLNAFVHAEAKVTAIDGRLVDFDVSASDERDQIGRGTHRRAIVQMDRLRAKLSEKAEKLQGGIVLPSYTEPNAGELSKLTTIIVERDGPLVTAILNRPQKLNAVDRQMTSDFEQLNAWLAGHPDIRVVIVTGAGEAFCAGDDVKEVGTRWIWPKPRG